MRQSKYGSGTFNAPYRFKTSKRPNKLKPVNHTILRLHNVYVHVYGHNLAHSASLITVFLKAYCARPLGGALSDDAV